MKGERFERGQALVLIVLSVVAIFGFAALAVDMGRIYAERRRAQSAADASALAAAYAVTHSELTDRTEIKALVNQTALATALENGYDGVSNNTVTVNNPPTDGGHYEECRCEYIQVIIDSQVDPIFVQLLGRGVSQIQTISIARARLSQPISTGNAIHALIEDNESGDGVEVDGDINLKVINGSIRSNKNGVKKGSSGNVKVSHGEIITADGWTNENGVTASGGIREIQALRVPVPPAPDCNLPSQTVSGPTLNPGLYDGITLNTGNYVMKKGIYCLNGDFRINGNTSVKGDGIFIVMLKGRLDINGDATVQWKRPNDQQDPKGQQWGGLLVFVPPPNDGEVNLTGTNQSWFIGTVFAPKSMCQYGGNNFTTATSAQLVCHQVRLHGNPNITFNYNDEQVYRMPPIVELVK